MKTLRFEPLGYWCPANLMDGNCEPFVVRLSRSFDDDGCERGERINGYDQCPKCRCWWPCIEEPDCWEEAGDGKWIATGWWGAAMCEECGLLMSMQPDGTPETYVLS